MLCRECPRSPKSPMNTHFVTTVSGTILSIFCPPVLCLVLHKRVKLFMTPVVDSTIMTSPFSKGEPGSD